MGKPTPGPWNTYGGMIFHSGPAGALGLKLGSPWREEAWCGDDADAETLANAALIAAAPDLLDFAKAHDAYMLAAGYAGPEDAALHPKAAANWRACRAAIARALPNPDTEGQDK